MSEAGHEAKLQEQKQRFKAKHLDRPYGVSHSPDGNFILDGVEFILVARAALGSLDKCPLVRMEDTMSTLAEADPIYSTPDFLRRSISPRAFARRVENPHDGT